MRSLKLDTDTNSFVHRNLQTYIADWSFILIHYRENKLNGWVQIRERMRNHQYQ